MKASRKTGVAPKAAVPKPAAPVRDRRHWLAAAALSALTLLAYINSFASGFVLDNREIILQDTRVHEASAANLGLIFSHTYWWPYAEGGLYRPLTTLTYLFNYAILGNGDSPAGYHCVNLLLQIANVLLVYAIARRLLQGFWPPVFVAALWAVHPVLTESVTNIVGRADLLGGMALLGALWMYWKSADTDGRRRWAWLAGLFAVTTAGVFCKESAAVIPAVILLYELTWWKERKRSSALVLGLVVTGIALEIMWFVRGAVFSQLPAPLFPYWDNPLVDAGFWTAKLTALNVLGRYIWLLVWPARLSCDYSFNQIPLAAGSLADWLAWLTVAASAGAAVVMYRRNKPLFFFIGVAFLTLLPSANLLFPLGTIMADRFLYLPAIALAACAVSACYALAGRISNNRAAPVLLGVLVAALAARTLARNADWHDDLSLMTAAVAASPDSYKTHALLASALNESDPDHSHIDRVIAEAEKSLAILNPVADWHNNAESFRRTAGYYVTRGDLRRSPADYRRSLALLLRVRAIVQATTERRQGAPSDEQMADVERSISSVESRLNQPADAIEAARNAQRLDPASASSYHQVASALLAAGRTEDAAVELVEGSLVTADVSLRQELIKLYEGGLDQQHCATVPGPYGPAINPKCEIVRRHVCAASVAALDLYQRLGRADLIEKTKAMVAGQFSCP